MIYADWASTAPPLAEVIDALLRCLREDWGNPSSRQHTYGRRAMAALDTARAQVAALLNAHPDEIVFTSGATEALNLAVLGVAERSLATRPRFLAPATEHAAVLEPLARVALAGGEVTLLPVDAHGRVDAQQLVCDERTALVAAMLVNNETGVQHDLPALAARAHEHGALLLCDATQAVGKLAVDVTALDADLLALTAHKIGGPMGVGALWLRRGLALSAQLHGGGQERGMRAGTANLPGIVGFGVAAELARTRQVERHAHLARLTGLLETGVRAAIPGVIAQGAEATRAPGISMLTVRGLRRGWLAQLATVAASGGSACASASGKPSHVLLAMGVAIEDAGNSIRISLGERSTEHEVVAIVAELAHGAARLQG